jgi:HEAT repeat protein
MELKARQRKEQVRILLEKRDISSLAEWGCEDRNILRTLTTFLYDDNSLINWRAIEGLAEVASRISQSDLDSVRRLLQRLFWSMNDESGSVGWHAPEAIGEILLKVPALIDEYGPILGSFLREEPFERGVHYSLARITAVRADLFKGFAPEFARSMNDSDPYIRAFALLALNEISGELSSEAIKVILKDKAELSLYDWETGTIKNHSITEIAQRCLISDLGISRKTYRKD